MPVVKTVNNNMSSNVQQGGISATQLYDLLSTLMQAVEAESSKITTTLDAKLTDQNNRKSAESARLVAALVAMGSKFISAVENLQSEYKQENEKLAEPHC